MSSGLRRSSSRRIPSRIRPTSSKPATEPPGQPGGLFRRSIIAKIIFDEKCGHSVSLNTIYPAEGVVAIECHPDDEAKVKQLLSSENFDTCSPDTELVSASFAIELTTDDINELRSGKRLHVDGKQFGVAIRLTKTPIDYLNENPLPHQTGTNL